jgi:endoglucanase
MSSVGETSIREALDAKSPNRSVLHKASSNNRHHGESGIMKTAFLRYPMTLVLSAIIACSQAPPPADPAAPAAPLRWLSTKGNRIVDDMDRTMVLRGVNRSGLEYNKKGNKIGETEIRFICAEWKAGIIRIPFNEDWILNDPSYNRRLDRVIGWIVSNGAYALLDLQWENTRIRIAGMPDEKSADMWKMLAGRHRNNPGVLYDLHNEVHDTTWEAWRDRAGLIIKAIRSVHPKALVFVSGLDWAYDLRGWEEKPLPFENVVYSTHPYPFKGEPWAWDKYFGSLAERFPVFVGEFGGSERDLEWGAKLIAYLDSKNLGWAAWSWVDQPVLTLRDRRTPTAFGRLVLSALKKHATADADTICRK